MGWALGNALLGSPGAKAGELLGRGAGALFSKITGLGDYKVNSNTLMGAAAADSLPMFGRAGRSTRIAHREYLQDIVTSSTIGAFKIETFPIQPALDVTFPWLGPVATQFEEYQLNGVIFEFKSNSYDALASTNTASGTVIMTTNYNVYNPQFVNKQQMEQYEFTCSSKPSVNLIHPIECARGESPLVTLQTRNDAKLLGDLRLYDFGNFNIATVGMQGASTNIGELWVSYDISFYKPRVGNVSDAVDHFVLNSAKDIGCGGGNFGYFSSTPTLTSTSNFGVELDKKLGTITIPQTYTGNVYVLYAIFCSHSTPVISYLEITGTNGATPLNVFGTVGTVSPHNNSTGLAPYMNFANTPYSGYGQYVCFSCVSGGTITLSGGTDFTPTLVDSADLLVGTLPSSFS